MLNKNKYLVKEIIKGVGKEYVLLEYIEEPGDPQFDDLPSEQLQPGEIVYVKFEKQKQPEKPFNG